MLLIILGHQPNQGMNESTHQSTIQPYKHVLRLELGPGPQKHSTLFLFWRCLEDVASSFGATINQLNEWDRESNGWQLHGEINGTNDQSPYTPMHTARPISHSVTQSLSHWINQSLSHWVTESLNPSVTQSLTHSVTQSLSHSAKKHEWDRERNGWKLHGEINEIALILKHGPRMNNHVFISNFKSMHSTTFNKQLFSDLAAATHWSKTEHKPVTICVARRNARSD